jgi:hypothetical protein
MSKIWFGLVYVSRCEWEQSPGVLCGAPAVAVDVTLQRCLCGAHAATTLAERQRQSGLPDRAA